MNTLSRLRQSALSLVLALLAVAPALPAWGQSMPSARAPMAKAAIVESMKLPPEAAATVVRLDAPDPAAIDRVKSANARAITKRLQIGINRDTPPVPETSIAALAWQQVEGGYAARWSVTSAGARALRIGLQAKRTTPSLQIRFVSPTQPDRVEGPVTEAQLNAFAGRTYWSTVLEGDTGIVELFVAGEAPPRGLSIRLDQVAHLLASPADPNAEKLLKDVGDSGFCEVNFVCRTASDSALASAGEAVARMTFSEGSSTFLCTGTLLNSTSGFVPYFYTAAHCISTQAAASTLVTDWFYESTACGSDSLNPNTERVAGGATLLYANGDYDISFMRLNSAPPGGATYAGWDAATLSNGAALTAIHHPVGDLKKVSLGSMGGFVQDSNLTDRTGSFIKSNWNSISTGVTEVGSSGSGIFSKSGGTYAFRGGLLGGPSSCSASSSNLFDYYSRFDVAYQTVSQYLAASAPANYTALWWNPSESGWGVNVSQQGDIVFATLFTYDTNSAPMWLVMSAGVRQSSGDTFSGPLYRTTGTPYSQLPFGGASVSQVGTMTLSFSGANSGTLSYSVNGIPVTKTITKQLFGPTGAATCTPTSGSRAGATNYTDLWWNPSESGWGINLTQQGNVMFATLFIYGNDGQVFWLVMSNGAQQGDGSFSGALYQTLGNGRFDSSPWPGVQVFQVGSMSLRFNNGESGTLTYTVNGQTITKSITRQVFSTPVPFCS